MVLKQATNFIEESEAVPPQVQSFFQYFAFKSLSKSI